MSGRKNWCETCEGSGKIFSMVCTGGAPYEQECDCPDCDGNGYWTEDTPPFDRFATAILELQEAAQAISPVSKLIAIRITDGHGGTIFRCHQTLSNSNKDGK